MAGGRPYTILSAGDYGVAGAMTIPAEAKAMGARPCWSGYVWVEDVDKAAAKLTAAGGSVKRPPGDIPGVGRFAVVADPHGAFFMLFRDAGGLRRPRPPPTRPAWSAGANCTPATAPPPSPSTPACSAGPSATHGYGRDGRLPVVRLRRRRQRLRRHDDPRAADARAVLALLFQRGRRSTPLVGRVKAKGGKIVTARWKFPAASGSSMDFDL